MKARVSPPLGHGSGVLAAVRTPVRLAVMTYVGAAGLIGLLIVGSLLVSPGGSIAQLASEPVRQLVQSIVPLLGGRPFVVEASWTGTHPAPLPTVVIDVRVLPPIGSSASQTSPLRARLTAP